jgi:hypothetical protein
MTPLVFISHSSEDRGIAARVCEALERLGLGCWLASRDIDPGENFQEAIVKAIRSARVIVLVFTGNANNSSEIKKEIALASQNHLAVIPLRMEDVTPSDAFLYELSTRQWVDALSDWDRAMRRLAEQIGEIAGQQPTAPAAPQPGSHAAAGRRRLALIAAGAAAALLVVAGGAAYRLGREHAATPAASVPAAAALRAVGRCSLRDGEREDRVRRLDQGHRGRSGEGRPDLVRHARDEHDRQRRSALQGKIQRHGEGRRDRVRAPE